MSELASSESETRKCFYPFHRRSRPRVVMLKAFSNCDRCECDNKGLDVFLQKFFHSDP